MSLVLLGIGGGGSPIGELTTEIRVRRIPGSTASLVRLPVAVPEDLPADTPFNVDGWAAQVYHVTPRVRQVVALVPGDQQSLPRRLNVLSVSVGEGDTPAAAGTYPTLDLSDLMVVMRINGVDFEGRISEAVATDVVAPIGPGHRSQTGPDLLRREHYLVRFKRAGVVGAGDEAEDYVACADVHVTRSVDSEMAVIEIQIMNGAWRSTSNPFQTNPSCSGKLYLDSVRVPLSSLPAGFTVQHIAPNPFATVTGSDVFGVAPMPGANDIHFMPTGGQCAMRFGVWNPATVTTVHALCVLRGWDRGFGVSGPLSYHHRHAFGVRRDLMLDIQAYRRGPAGEEIQFRDAGAPGTETWERQEALANTAAAQVRTLWETGTQNSSYLFYSPRRGWQHPFGREPYAEPGGAGIYGHSIGLQACATFDVNMVLLDGLITRMGLAAIDLEDGRALHGDALISNNSSAWEDVGGGHPGQVGRLPYLSNNSDRRIAWMHPHLVQPDALLSGGWGAQNPNQFRLAPSDRDWNAPYGGKSCPYEAQINWQAISGEDGWSPFDHAHLFRAAMPTELGIWMWDDPLAHRLAEQVANSYAMLGLTQHDVAGHLHADYQTIIAPMLRIAATNLAPPRAGYWISYPGGPKLMSNIRAHAWALHFALQWWEVAPPAEKTRLHPPVGVGNSWFRAFAQMHGGILLENGQGIRADDSPESAGFNPHPWRATNYGPTDLPNRTGALPNTPGQHYSAAVSFQAAFLTGTLFALKHGPLAGEAAASLNDGTVHAAANLARYARANYPNDAVKRPSKFAVTSVGGSGAVDTPLGPNELNAGLGRWRFVYLLSQSPELHDLNNFQGWPAQYGFRDTGDLSMLDVACYERGASTSNLIIAFNAFDSALAALWAQDGFRRFPFGEHAWWQGCLAELIHRREGRET